MPVPTNLTRQSQPSSSSTGKNVWIAAGEGDLQRVQECIDQEGIAPTAADEFTYTPLHAAASYGHLDILRFLLTHASAPSNAVDVTDSDGDTPLFVCEDVATARCLVEEFHANAKHTNHEGLTPAQQADENEHPDVAEYLRSVTGEAPSNSLTEQDEDYAGLDEQDADGDIVARGSLNDADDRELEHQTDQLMAKVEEIMIRADREGFDPEDELRKIVSESVAAQIIEGMDRPTPSNNDQAAHSASNNDTL
ncbi:ankyrin [Testicularia cyperi]|uniref:Ankyrin n=1 Tax=Testicularia cyperi TaxID=1882483 RepID=A0A317XRS5_9BASI|nr:ankyrin [Testicularia cyperi]